MPVAETRDVKSCCSRARTGQDRANLYDEITGKIIAELEAGRVRWVQPWGTTAAKAPLTRPKTRRLTGNTVALTSSSSGEP